MKYYEVNQSVGRPTAVCWYKLALHHECSEIYAQL